MANRKVTLVLYCKTPNGWKRYPAMIGGNGRVKPGYALVDGVATHFGEAKYLLRTYKGKKTVYTPAGDNATDALFGLHQKERLTVARHAATAADAVLVEAPGRVNLRTALRRHEDAALARNANVAAKVLKFAGEEFLDATGKVYADEVGVDDVTGYLRKMQKRLAPRTVTNRFRLVKSFLRSAGVAVTDVMGRAPRFEQALPQIYERDELVAFLTSLDTGHKMLFDLLLWTGLREQEAMYLQWSDISFTAGTLTVRGKPDLGFAVKDSEEREVSLPPNLATDLKAWRVANPRTRFVVGTADDKPNTHILRLLKRLVRKAGLNCGSCPSCIERKECERWFLHKFRSTYCTAMLRHGYDLRTVQQMMGHSDLESTMRYLRPAEGADVRARMATLRFY